MKKNAFVLLCLGFSLNNQAQESQTGYSFLRLPVSAHAAALGGDNITLIEDDPSLAFHNPALLSSVSDKTLNFNFMNYMDGANMASASFNKVVKEQATWGVMAQYIDYGSMKEVDENNIETGQFSAKDIALAGAFSYQLTNRLAGGITARLVNSYIGNFNALAVAVDLGLNYYDAEREWSVSAVAKNLGGELDAYEEEYSRLPIDVQIGVSKQLIGSPLRLSATLVDLNHWDYSFFNHFVVGADVLLSSQLYLAVGYNLKRAHDMKITASDDEKGSSHGAGLALGAGLMLDRFKLNLAYGKYHVSSHSLIINVSYSL